MKITHFDDEKSCQLMVKFQIKNKIGESVQIKQYDSIITAAIDLVIDRPDVVICDFEFKNGLTACRILDILYDCKAKVIFLSAHHETVIIDELMKYKGFIPDHISFYQKGNFDFIEELKECIA